MNRPEHVSCIKHYHHDKRRESWCGRVIANEFHLVDLNHAAGLHASGSRLEACSQCTTLAVAALRASADQTAATEPESK